MANSLTTSSGAMLRIGMSVDSAQAKAEFNKTMKILKQESQIRLTIDGTDFTKTIRTYQDSMKNLVQTTTLWNHSTSKSTTEITGLTSAMERVNNAIANQTNQVRNLSNAQNNLNAHTQRSVSVFQDFTNTFLKMAKFNTINLIYDGIINKMSEAIQITNDFDAAMTEFKKVTDITSLSLSDYTEQLGQLGEATARTTTQMLQSATEFSKAGFTPEESARLAQVASLYQNIADAEISAGEAASFITSQIKAFKDYGVEADNATQVIDKLNEVSNNFSVSSTDIASALTKQSASLAAYGNDLNSSIALVTAGTEIMTGQAGKVARGLRTIGANITQLAQNAKEFDITVNGATKTIQLWNETGTDMLNTYDVLKQISAEWDNMTNAEKSSLAIDLAKKTQMDTFLAVLGNFEDAEKAYTTALLSEGSAWEENEKYMESIEAHQAELKAQWEQLILSAPFEDLEKALLSTGTALLKFANSDVGQTVIKITSLIAIMTALNAAVKLFQSLLATDSTSIFLSTISKLIAGEVTLTQVTTGLTTAMLANPLFWGAAVITGVVLLIQHIKKLSHAYEEHVQELREVTSEYKNQQDATKTLTQDLEDIRKKIEEINQQKLQITDKDDLENLEAESQELSDQETSLKNQLILEEAKTKELEKQAKLKLQDTLKEDSTITTYDFSQDNSGYVSGNEVDYAREVTTATPLEGLEKQLQGYENLKNKLSEAKEEAKSFGSTQAKAIEENLRLQKELEDAMSNLESEMTDNLDVAKQAVELNDEHKTSAQNLINQYNELINVEDDSASNLDSIRSGVEDLTDAEEESSNVWDEFLGNIEGIQSAYETLTKAADEYNQNGFITASTLKQLNKLSPEYVAILSQEGDTYENINSVLGDYLDKEKEQAIQKVNLARYTSILELCENTLKEQTEKTSKVVEESGTKASEASEGYDELGNAAIKAAIGMKAVEDGGLNTDEFYEKFNKINDYFDGLVDNINKTNLGATKSSKSAASSHKDAWKEAFEEEQRLLKHSLEMNEITEIEYYNKLKDLNEKYFGEISGKHKQYLKEYQENEEEIYKGLKSVYDKVADYLQKSIEKGYENAINALKKEEKQVLAEIKSQIDALKREKQDVLDDINEQIDGLKKKKDKVLNYWNAQIDKIKESNDNLQKQNELLEKQQALQQAKSQKVMVMKGGKFELSENESAVAQAEQALSQYQDQASYEQQIAEMEKLRDAQVKSIEDRISALEDYKDYMDRYYDEEIDALEQYYDEVQRQYEAQIEALQEQLDTFKQAAEEQKEIEEARLAAQLLGIEKESDLFEMSLSNLSSYVEKYNSLVSQLQIPSAIMGGTIGNIIGSVANTSTGGGYSAAHMTTRASGDSSFKNDEIALVGESPNAELVLGSHLNRSVNSGKLIHLSKGSGVVNAESTSTLAGLLNGVVSPTNVSNSRSTTQSFTFGNITLPNVTDGDSFVNTLSHKFNNYAIQYSSNRK